MPHHFSKNLADIIQKLVKVVQSKRLGNTREGISAIVNHKWFSTFDWSALESFEMKAPYVPVIQSTEDSSNFNSSIHEVLPVSFC